MSTSRFRFPLLRSVGLLSFILAAGAASAHTAFVSDAFTDAVEAFDAETGSFQGEIGVGYLVQPMGVVASKDTIYVSDLSGIFAFGLDGSLKATFGEGFAGFAEGMALAGNDLYQVDATGHILDFDTDTGALLNTFGSELSIPLAATVSGDRLYVTDGQYVRAFDRHTGDLLQTIDAGDRRILTGLAIAKDGTLFVADDSMAQILAFDVTTGLQTDEFADGFLQQPASLAIDPDGMLNVGDFGQACVFRFDQKGGFYGLYGDGFLNSPSGIAFAPTAVPEPAAFVVFGLGFINARRKRAR